MHVTYNNYNNDIPNLIPQMGFEEDGVYADEQILSCEGRKVASNRPSSQIKYKYAVKERH